jgi:hypothetical protein
MPLARPWGPVTAWTLRDGKVEGVAVPRVVGRDGHCVLAGVPERQDVDAVVLAGGEGNCLSRGDRLGSAERLSMGGAVITAPQIGGSCLGSVWDRRLRVSSPAGRVCAPPQRRSLPLAPLSKDRRAVTRRA